MSPSVPSQRGARSGRTLIVRDGLGVTELAQALRRSTASQGHVIDEVDDLYDALAALSTASSADAVGGPIGAIAVPLRAAGDDPRSVRDAFRRVDPAIRLLLLAPRGATAVAENAGFDDVVFLPAGSRDLASALGYPEVQTNPKSTEDVLTPVAGVRPAPEKPMRIERQGPTSAPAGTPARSSISCGEGLPQRDMVDLVIDDALQAFAARRDRAAEPGTGSPLESLPLSASSDIDRGRGSDGSDSPVTTADLAGRGVGESIGDTDLVEAVIEGGDRLSALALELIRRELHIQDVRLLPNNDSAGTDARTDEQRVSVLWKGVTLGALASTQASAQALAPWADWLGHWLRLDRCHDDLRVLAWTDELTGAGNRRAFERVLDETVAAARPERRPVSLMYFDIDNFKSYNDRFGHAAGDEVLRETLELLRSVIRRGDHVFRVGGDEFVVIFADSRGARAGGGPFESVETIATRFRERVGQLKFPQLDIDGPGTVSISAGVATYPWDGHDARSLLAHADQLSLQSKRSGKNMITFGPGAKDHCGDE
ncbi:MAG: diguanylate cyclase [Phycisphaerae bacterium]|nr:diguanylate cyclase [Phycisphaerae bacterium]